MRRRRFFWRRLRFLLTVFNPEFYESAATQLQGNYTFVQISFSPGIKTPERELKAALACGGNGLKPVQMPRR
jgi:hypothetical protein